jgi:3-phenylpropionate/trans-cinnamate dioxygenase ferredoxin reductase subunit
VAHSLSGAEFPFDRLALAVGARPRRLLLEGVDLPGVLYLRNADDALRRAPRLIREYLTTARGAPIS